MEIHIRPMGEQHMHVFDNNTCRTSYLAKTTTDRFPIPMQNTQPYPVLQSIIYIRLNFELPHILNL
ncbi:unnamed protein product [Callosobruchus maculatus]|uniref:Uncharacterized protein n=1 Tax=Callosobruchus maculatus TaxID=64391 RepID=A0A653CLJ2_CALMS|nr:unnamed protein product [Callosobruchus maculatus]